MIIQILLAPSFLFIKLFFPAVIDMKRLNAVGIYRISDDLLTISKQADIEKLYSNESRFLKVLIDRKNWSQTILFCLVYLATSEVRKIDMLQLR